MAILITATAFQLSIKTPADTI